ncbi:MAG: PilN domain-containing protein [Gammaproteobacteria bacterium]|nr:PilN domain-containing protein [Gammaproteobacteria bacterium]
MSNATSTQYGPDLGTRVQAFFRWWSGELWDMVPDFFKQPAYPDGELLLVSFEGDGAVFLEYESGQWQELARILANSSPVEVRSKLPASVFVKKIRIARLPTNKILHTHLTFPLSAEPELEKILGYQLDTISPYPPDQIYHAHRIQDRDGGRGTLDVEVFLAPKELVDNIVDRMREWDLAPASVDCLGAREPFDPGINLLPGNGSLTGGGRRLSRFNMLLLLVNLLLLAALALTHLMDKADAEQELTTLVQTAREEAESANVLREQVTKLQEQNSFLEDMKKSRVPALQVIDELTKILPDDTWLEGALYSANEISLSGVSSKSSNLISKIERSPLFEEAAFQSSVVQDFRSGGERFQIRARITVPHGDVE